MLDRSSVENAIRVKLAEVGRVSFFCSCLSLLIGTNLFRRSARRVEIHLELAEVEEINPSLRKQKFRCFFLKLVSIYFHVESFKLKKKKDYRENKKLSPMDMKIKIIPLQLAD